MIGPIVIIVTQLVNPHGSGVVAVFAPSLVGLVIGLSLAQDLSYDGTALWVHISAGVRGVDDRTGRVMSTIDDLSPVDGGAAGCGGARDRPVAAAARGRSG